MPEALLEIDGLTKRFGGVVASDEISLERAAGRAARDHRPERRRQDHADRPARGRARARCRAHPLRRPATSPRCRSTAAASSGSRARSRSPRCSPTSPRSTTSRSPCRRMPATRSVSGARRASEAALREPAARRARARGPGRPRRHAGLQAQPRRAPPARDRDGARHAARACCCSTSRWPGWGRRRARAWSGCCASSSASLTILLIEHDMEAVFALADRITVLVYGRIIASGDAGGDPRQRRGAAGLSRRAGSGAGRADAWLRSRCSKCPPSRPATA